MKRVDTLNQPFCNLVLLVKTPGLGLGGLGKGYESITFCVLISYILRIHLLIILLHRRMHSLTITIPLARTTSCTGAPKGVGLDLPKYIRFG
jgi:hypothetical protein